MHKDLNVKRDDDLKFIPLSINEPFIDKESSWFPVIDSSLPNFNNMTEGFISGFPTPMNNSNLQGAPLKTLDYIPNNYNMQNGNMQNNKIFNEEFPLYYPSETLGEELFSYNKDEKCKQNNNSEDMNKNQMINFNNNNNIYSNNMSNKNSNSNNNNNNMNNNINNNTNNNINSSNNNLNNTVNNSGVKYTDNINKQELNMGNMNTQNNCECTSEPPHMELLRSLDFYSYLESGYRGEGENKDVDKIFNIIKEDKSIIDTLKAYNLPKPIYDLIIKKIIKITLENSKYKWGD